MKLDLGFSSDELQQGHIVPNPEEFQEAFSDVVADSKEIQEAAKSSLDFFASLAIPLTYQYAYPDTYLAVWQWITSFAAKTRDFSQLALGLPRGFGKTILLKLFILYCILFTEKKFILVLGENIGKAVNIVTDVADMLNELNIISVFGDWKNGQETDRQDLKKFGFRGRNIVLMAGTVEVIRGITLKNERPDVIIFDDIQSREMAESKVISEALEREMIGTAMKAKSPHGCLFLFVANMYPTKYSILRKLKTNPNWLKFIVGGLLNNGESLWEELQPREQLYKEFINDLLSGHPEIFFSEVLNDDTATGGRRFDLSKVPEYPFVPNEVAVGKFIVIDPATDKEKADEVSIGYFEVYNGTPVLKKYKEGRFSPGKTIDIALHYALTEQCRLIVVESNAYQYTLLYWFQQKCLQYGIQGIEAVDIYSGRASKTSRILTMFKSLAEGEIQVHPDVRAGIFYQISQFDPLKTDNTDGLLDLLTYAPRVLELYGEFVISLNDILQAEFADVRALPAEILSPF